MHRTMAIAVVHSPRSMRSFKLSPRTARWRGDTGRWRFSRFQHAFSPWSLGGTHFSLFSPFLFAAWGQARQSYRSSLGIRAHVLLVQSSSGGRLLSSQWCEGRILEMAGKNIVPLDDVGGLTILLW